MVKRFLSTRNTRNTALVTPQTVCPLTAQPGSLPGTFQTHVVYSVTAVGSAVHQLQLTGDILYTLTSPAENLFNSLVFQVAIPIRMKSALNLQTTTVMFALLPGAGGPVNIPVGTCAFELTGEGLTGRTSNIMALPEGCTSLKILLPSSFLYDLEGK